MPMTLDELLESLAVLYTPHARDPGKFVAQYREALRDYKPEVIAKAWPKIRDQHDRTDRWPTIAFCKQKLDQAASEMPKPSPKAKAYSDWRKPTAEERANVSALLADLKRAIAVQRVEEQSARMPGVNRDQFRRVEAGMKRWWDR